jgi:gamma-butyrobetaine dioxygenase
MRKSDPITTWTAEEIDTALPRFAHDELARPAATLEWLDAIVEYWVAIVEGVPTTYEGLQSVSDRIGIAENTNYGPQWDIVAVESPDTLVNSDRPLRVHTDLPYRRLPPGLQLLLCETADAGGGETVLVDGYGIAEALHSTDRKAWQTLTGTDQAFAYVNEHQRYIGGGPVIGLTAEGAPDIIRHAPDLVLPLKDESIQAEVDQSLAVLMNLAASPTYEFRIRLEPGQLVAFNNHRVLHGRGDVDIRTGGRRILGCYSTLDELASSRRVLRRTTNPSNARSTHEVENPDARSAP